MASRDSDPAARPSWGPRLLGTLVGLVFMASGVGFTLLILREWLPPLSARSWPLIPCRILASEWHVDREQGGQERFRFAVEYEYEQGGATYRSHRDQGKEEGRESLATVQRLVAQYPPGSARLCSVHPQDPLQAVLRQNEWWQLLLVLLPLLFVVVGFLLVYALWRGDAPSLRSKALPRRRGLWLFSFLFMGLGAAGLYAVSLRPLLRMWAAREWPAVPCEILTSHLARQAGSKGATFAVYLRFRYDFGGRTWQANRYSFNASASSGAEGKRRILAGYPEGALTVCYVNPADPLEAVISRGPYAELWFGLIPLVFFLLGAGTLAASLRGRKENSSDQELRPAWGTAGEGEPAPGLERAWRKPRYSRLTKLAGLTVGAFFWCGVTAPFVFMAVRSWSTPHPEYFLSVFITPFVLIGLALLVGIGYHLLTLLNPQIRLLAPEAAPLGGRLQVVWEITSGGRRLRELVFTLRGTEQATYRRGSRNGMETRHFHEEELARLPYPGLLRSGELEVTLPADTMHTFKAARNQILWSLRVRGVVPGWPDVSDEYALTVLPLPLPAHLP